MREDSRQINHEGNMGAEGESRRDFLKKAGAVAWIVPTMQVVNMASAAAATTSGSMVTTTPSPSQPPGCAQYVFYRIKADWTGQGWTWTKGFGANDCITEGTDIDGDDLGTGLVISGNVREAVVSHSIPDCEIVKAAHKAGQNCLPGAIAAGGASARFTAEPQDISHVELLIKCCATD